MAELPRIGVKNGPEAIKEGINMRQSWVIVGRNKYIKLL